ncbi:MAG: hypothetical protein LBT62_06120 [Deltaproteobacteria bacterium]|nr:hypothetical protein [Deltaproteobacteria bacterium]
MWISISIGSDSRELPAGKPAGLPGKRISKGLIFDFWFLETKGPFPKAGSSADSKHLHILNVQTSILFVLPSNSFCGSRNLLQSLCNL